MGLILSLLVSIGFATDWPWWTKYLGIGGPQVPTGVSGFSGGCDAFQVFAQVYIMTRGGPGDATVTMQLLIFRNGFQYFRMGYAAAISWLLFLVIFALATIQLRGYRSQQMF